MFATIFRILYRDRRVVDSPSVRLFSGAEIGKAARRDSPFEQGDPGMGQSAFDDDRGSFGVIESAGTCAPFRTPCAMFLESRRPPAGHCAAADTPTSACTRNIPLVCLRGTPSASDAIDGTLKAEFSSWIGPIFFSIPNLVARHLFETNRDL